ncbi:MAG TPA: DUF5683 domain-containing protein [Bacteroidales bacterium]|nr:DUF5683 domain-containing protein [Bacteroidales bacterium]
MCKKIFAAVGVSLFLFHSQRLSGQIKGDIDTFDTTKIVLHSPRKASFYSAVLPGLGQVYNKKWYKVPFIYAGGAVIIYYLKFNHDKYLEYRSNYIRKVANDPNDPVDYKFRYASKTTIKNNMDYWRRNRDWLIVGLSALYIANILDATVDAYLFEYDISPDLSMKMEPVLLNIGNSPTFGVSLNMRF